MKNTNVCPGCHKHCPLSAPRCKYGRNYAAKHSPETAPAPTFKHKWQRFATPDGLVWKLITTGKKCKKALCQSRLTEEQLLASLSTEEQQTLADLLERVRLLCDEAE